MDNLGRLTTPEEYIDYYFDQLKTAADQKNLQISKVGFLGLLLQLFSFTQYDTKIYYDEVFAESCPATADKLTSLTMHSSVYNYPISQSRASELVGNLRVNFNVLPILYPGVAKREIYIQDLEASFDSLPFVCDSVYTISIIRENSTTNYNCQIIDSAGKLIASPFLTNNPIIPIVDFKQYTEQINQYSVATYVYGSYYSQIIELEQSGNISNIEVSVLEEGQVNYKQYETSLVKYNVDPDSETIFIKYLPDNKIQIELGSGIRGKYIPNSTIQVNIKITQGSLGNIASQIAKPSSGSIQYFDTYDNGNVSAGVTLSISDFISIETDYGQYGSDVLDVDALRASLISYIRTRENLISERDYDDIFGQYVPDFMFLFKKTGVIDNIFYLFIPLYDRSLVPLNMLSYSPTEAEFNPNISGTTVPSVYKPEFTIGTNYMQRGEWDVDVNYNVGDTVIYINITYVAITPHLSSLSRSTSNSDYWRALTSTVLIQQGNWVENKQYYTGDIVVYLGASTVCILDHLSSVSNISPHSTYWRVLDSISSRIYVSPFLYIYNDFLRFYEGYLVNEDYSTYFSTITPNTDVTRTIVPLSLNIIYDRDNSRCKFCVQSFQDISSFNFKISIPQLNITEEAMIAFNTNSFHYYYTVDNGIILDTFDVEADLYDTTTYLFNYRAESITIFEDIKEVLALKKYLDPNSVEYIVNVPLILKSQYDSDDIYYLNKILATFNAFNITNNRMISDETQIRFINTSEIQNSLIQKLTTKHYVLSSYSNYDFTVLDSNLPLSLPLKMQIDLIGHKTQVTTEAINTSTEIRDFKLKLATLLKTNYTGTKIVFYKTQIHDFVFDNLTWIKDVVVTVMDSNASPYILSNFETISQKDVLEDLTKLESAQFCPILWHWDLNNLIVNYTLE